MLIKIAINYLLSSAIDYFFRESLGLKFLRISKLGLSVHSFKMSPQETRFSDYFNTT